MMQFDQSDEAIHDFIDKRFEMITRIASTVIEGKRPSMILSGPPGLGKSHTIEQELKTQDPTGRRTRIVKGYVRPTGLYRLLYENQVKGRVLVFDDSDSVFDDLTSLNLMKAALDSKPKRLVSYHSEAKLIDSHGRRMPKEFEYEGSIIFVTNVDFDSLIAKGHKLSKHLEALMSRSYYVSMGMDTPEHYKARIMQVFAAVMKLAELDLQGSDDVAAYIDENYLQMRELSIRETLKIASLRKDHPSLWRDMADVTCLAPGL